MAEFGHVDANLMLPPGFEAALDQGRTREVAHDCGDGGLGWSRLACG
jgi:hypothetical protein